MQEKEVFFLGAKVQRDKVTEVFLLNLKRLNKKNPLISERIYMRSFLSKFDFFQKWIFIPFYLI